ncbi:MAG: sel1 repeat family protein [Campylobacterales bacterium]|nr:sel1 repeat family protein [Campylobacterales bacterium]
MSSLQAYKSTMSDVKFILGEPAISQMSFGDKIVYKYFYKTSESSVDQMAMMKGDYKACKNCGEIVAIFSWKKGVDTDTFQLRGLSIKDSHLEAQTTKAIGLVQQKRFQEAYPELLDAAKKHFVPAQHILALMYLNGDGIEKNYKYAHYWFVQAASAEFPPSLYDLGAMYRNGEGVEKNNEIAKEFYIRSAKLNYALAMQELIKVYKEENNLEQMNYWLEKSQKN